MEAVVRWIKVRCPYCGNFNRKARRACKHCKGVGMMLKSVPDLSKEIRQ